MKKYRENYGSTINSYVSRTVWRTGQTQLRRYAVKATQTHTRHKRGVRPRSMGRMCGFFFSYCVVLAYNRERVARMKQHTAHDHYIWIKIPVLAPQCCQLSPCVWLRVVIPKNVCYRVLYVTTVMYSNGCDVHMVVVNLMVSKANIWRELQRGCFVNCNELETVVHSICSMQVKRSWEVKHILVTYLTYILNIYLNRKIQWDSFDRLMNWLRFLIDVIKGKKHFIQNNT